MSAGKSEFLAGSYSEFEISGRVAILDPLRMSATARRERATLTGSLNCSSRREEALKEDDLRETNEPRYLGCYSFFSCISRVSWLKIRACLNIASASSAAPAFTTLRDSPIENG